MISVNNSDLAQLISKLMIKSPSFLNNIVYPNKFDLLSVLWFTKSVLYSNDANCFFNQFCADMWSWLPLLGYDINGMAPTVGCSGELIAPGLQNNYMHDWRSTYKEHQVSEIVNTELMAMSLTNRKDIRNKEQGSYCFTMQIECQTNSGLAIYSIQ